MSPRAACRLEAIGFEEVYDYTAGIADWKAAGLDIEGSEDQGLRIFDATLPDVPTASTDEAIGQVRERTFGGDWDEAIVVDCDGIVVGRLRGTAWDRADHESVSAVMEPGPTTVRPDGSLPALLGRMEKRGTRLVVVSDPQGHLIGALLADDARRLVAGEPRERVWKDCEGCPGRWSTASAVD